MKRMKSFIASLLFAFIFALKISLLNAARNHEQLEPFDSQMLDLIRQFYSTSSKFPRVSLLTLSNFFMNIGKACIPTDRMLTSPELYESFSICVETFYSTFPNGVLQEKLLLAFNVFFDQIKNLFLRALEGHIAFPKNHDTSLVLWQTFIESAEHSAIQHDYTYLAFRILSTCSFLTDQWIALQSAPINFFLHYKEFMQPSFISNVFFYLSPQDSINKNFHFLVMHQIFFYDALVRIFEFVEIFPLCLSAFNGDDVKLQFAKFKEERKKFGQNLEALVFQSPLFNYRIYSIAKKSYCELCLDEFLKSSLFTAYQSVLHSLRMYEDNATPIGTELSGNLKKLKGVISQNSSPQVTLAALDPIILELKEEATNKFEILFEFNNYLRLFDDPAKASLIWRPILVCPTSSLVRVQGSVAFYICRIFAIVIKAYVKIENGFFTYPLSKVDLSLREMWPFIQGELTLLTEVQYWFQRRSRLKKSKFVDHLKGFISKKGWISDDFLFEIEENILSIAHIIFLSKSAEQEIISFLEHFSTQSWLLNVYFFAFQTYAEMQEQIIVEFQTISGSFAQHSADIRKLLSIFIEVFLECFCKLGEVEAFSSKEELFDAFSRLFQYRTGLADIITLHSNNLSPWKHLLYVKHKLKCQCHTCGKNDGNVAVRIAMLKWQEKWLIQVLQIFRKIHYDILIQKIGSFNLKLAFTLKSVPRKENITFNIQEMYTVLKEYYDGEEDSSTQATIQVLFSADLRQKFTSLDFILKLSHSSFEEFFNTFQLKMKKSTCPKKDPTRVPSLEQNIINERIYYSQTVEVYKSLLSNLDLDYVPSDSPSKREGKDTVTAKGLILEKKELEAQVKLLENYIDCISDIL